MRFKTKLTAIFSAIVLSIGILISYYVYASNLTALEIQIRQRLEEKAFHTMDQIDRMLFERFADIRVLATDPVITSKESTPREIAKRLIEYRNMYKTYVCLSFFDLDRIRIADTSGLGLGKQHRMVPHLEDALQGKISSASDIHVSKELKIPVIYFASPVKGQGDETIGIVAAKIPATKLYEITGGGAGIGEEDIRIDLVNKDGLLLYSNYNRKGILEDNLAHWEAFQRAKAGEEIGSLKDKYLGKEETISTFVHDQGYLDFPGNDWVLIMNVPTKTVFAPAVELRNRMIVILSAILVLSIVVVSLFSRTVSRPIIKLRDAAFEIGKGELDTKVEVTSRDEVGDLAESFNEMVSNLRKTMASRDSLNKEIAERKRTEEALRESEERFRHLSEAAFEGIAIHEEGVILKANDQYFEIFGYEPQELLGKQAIPITIAPESIEFTKKQISSGATTPYEVMGLKKDGTKFPIEIYAKPFEYQGRMVRVIALRDISERKQAEEALRESEERLKALIDNAPDGIYLIDPITGRFIDGNRKTEELVGYPREELIGKNFVDAGILPEEYIPKAMEGLEKNRQGQLMGPHEYELIRKDGSRVFVEIVSFPVARKGKVEIIGIARDINERKRAEEEQKKLQARLQEAKKMEAIATLAGGIAHEFNNTLVGITGNIDLLQMHLPDEVNIDKYAERMSASTHRMAHLTAQLLAYARGGKYQSKNISLTDFVEETLPLIKQTIDSSIRIETDLSHDISNVEADLTQMQMVLSAVLNNASEAIEGEGRIRITTRDEKIDEQFVKINPDIKPGPYVSFTVEDDGKGMDEETRSRIFDPFFTTKFQGRGLGMAAVYGIVTNHGGWISVDSELGKGTVVRIYLPAVKVEVKEEKMPKIEPTKGTGTILVIEDEDIVIDVICAMVKRLGYRVLLARTGKEAVSIAKRFDADIDLAILDVILPDLAAKEAYREIMEARPNLKVIVCSGYAIDGPPQEIMDAGAQDFIQKPFSYATLSEKLKEVLEGK